MPDPTSSAILNIEGLQKQLELEVALRRLTNKIHSCKLDEIFTTVRKDLKELVGADRVTLFVKAPGTNEIYSKYKDGTETKQIRVPIDANSIAGFVASTRQGVRIADVYDEAQLRMISPQLRFDKSWDEQTGFRTKSVLAVPVAHAQKLQGVLQVVNKSKGKGFTDYDGLICQEIGRTLGVAVRNQKQMTTRRSKYDRLILQELLADETLEDCQRLARKQDCSVEHIMMTKYKLPRSEILQSLAEYFRVEPREFTDRHAIPFPLLEPFTLDYLKHHRAVPLAQEGKLVEVLMEDPRDIVTRDDICSRLEGRPIRVRVGLREDILAFIDLFFGQAGPGLEEETPQNLEDIMADLEAEIEEEEKIEEDDLKEDDKGIIRLVNQIVEQADSMGASDVHMEPRPDGDMGVRFRIDGICHEYTKVPRRWWRAITSRIKIMSGLDIAERRLPQDGKIKFKNYGRRDIELRVATLPTQGAVEDVVMRLLSSSKPIPIDELGMREQNLAAFKKVVKIPYGIFLCVGPTGSGKTTTLHSALGYINRPEVKIWTAEDPVEITQQGIRQVQIHHKIGLTFERALRAFLRADPDIIMVGEMRDLETASAGIEASLTGHLVFSTLHTNNAPETLVRLLDLGLDPYSFGDSLLAVLAQRLVRTLCPRCKKETLATAEERATLEVQFKNPRVWEMLGVEEPASLKLMKAAGCDYCHHTGYKGRMAIHELLVVNDAIRLLIYNKAKAHELRDEAFKLGMWTLRQDGIYKIIQGLTDIREVQRVAN